ncbi:MAG TPA: ABC transporter substrate-binding protein [Cyanobacteria bacterium UBA11049]|nr:ABC transporter substrate-binding protein [Cyanobacteria bacterium UBA11049]
MLQSKKNAVLILYLIALCLIGPLIFWLSYRGGNLSPQSAQRSPNGGFFGSNRNPAIQKQLSSGGKVLVSADINPDKQAGVQAFAAGDYNTAVDKFTSSLQINRNDPETWIYLENSAAAAISNTIKIGVSVPIGGNLNVAREILRGVAQAQYEINHSGGIGGRLIQVEIANDDNDPTLAKQIAAEFVKDPSVLAVVGHNSSDASIAAAPVYQQGGLVMISPTSVARNLSGSGSYIFRTTPNTRAIADTLARYTVNSAHKTKIAICSDSQAEATQSFKEEFTWALFDYGGKVIDTACNFSAPNFNPIDIPSQAVSNGADAILLAPSVNRINQAVDVARANQRRLDLLGVHTMYTFQTLQQGLADMKGMVLSVAWHPSAIPGSSFPTNAKRFWGGAGSWRTAMAYDATGAIFAGLKPAPTRDKLQKALSNSGFSTKGATGVVQFLPSGDRNMKGILVRVEPGKNSGTGYDFVPFQP